jgi:hypothetical protein
VYVLQHLWSDAGAWKIQTTFEQKAGMLGAGEVFTVRGIPLPTIDSVTELNVEKELADHRVRLVGISYGSGNYRSFKKQRKHASPVLDFEISPNPGDRRPMVVSVIDEFGVECRRGTSFRSGMKFAQVFQPNATSTKVDVTFALPQSIQVEFVALPTIAKSDNE